MAKRHLAGNLHSATKLFTVATMAAQFKGNSINPTRARKGFEIYSFPVLHLLIKCLATKLRTNRSVRQVLLYVNSTEEVDRNEKYWIKNTRERSNSVFHTIRELTL